jgi:hypothetical protein
VSILEPQPWITAHSAGAVTSIAHHERAVSISHRDAGVTDERHGHVRALALAPGCCSAAM